MTQVNHNLLEIAQNRMRHLITVLLCFMLSFGFYQIAYSQEVHGDKSLKSYKLPPNLKKHFQDKYKDQAQEITSTLQETPQGPRGSIGIAGDIKFKNIKLTSSDISDRARAIASEFLKEESEILGFANISELHERKILVDTGAAGEYVHIYYDRYIKDIPLENAYILIEVGPDESIVYVSAALLPAPSELYQAAAKATITEEEARQSVLKELKSKNVETANIQIEKIRKVAVDAPPYIVWMLGANTRQPRGSWQYKVNAFSGEIISKTNILRRD